MEQHHASRDSQPSWTRTTHGGNAQQGHVSESHLSLRRCGSARLTLTPRLLQCQDQDGEQRRHVVCRVLLPHSSSVGLVVHVRHQEDSATDRRRGPVWQHRHRRRRRQIRRQDASKSRHTAGGRRARAQRALWLHHAATHDRSRREVWQECRQRYLA